MPRIKQSSDDRAASPSSAQDYFTDRTEPVAAFCKQVNVESTDDLKVLVFSGVGGIGKTTLLQKLWKELDAVNRRLAVHESPTAFVENISDEEDCLRNLTSPLPFAWFNLERLKDQTQAYREVLADLSSQLKRDYGIVFTRFDLCMKVLHAREGGAAVPIIDPRFNDAFNAVLPFLPNWISAGINASKRQILASIEKSPRLRELVQRVGGMEELVDLIDKMHRDDENLPIEMVKSFTHDLGESLKSREGSVCRAVLFLDTYETLWTGRESSGSIQATHLDEWVRQLAAFCLGCGVLVVISGRDRLMWVEDKLGGWKKEEVEQHQLGGLSSHDAQFYLSKRGVGFSPEHGAASPLQNAIILCCNTEPNPSNPPSCHLLYLALCADIVENTRREKGVDPKPSVFKEVQSGDVALKLASRFLKSLHNANMTLWIESLSLTPRFDKEAALALSESKKLENGLGGWVQIKRFSFIEEDDAGFYRMHKTMREVLPIHVDDVQPVDVHVWFMKHWQGRSKTEVDEFSSLSWFHKYCLEPEDAAEEWRVLASRSRSSAVPNMVVHSELMNWWLPTQIESSKSSEPMTALALTYLGHELQYVSVGSRLAILSRASRCCQLALGVFTYDDYPEQWGVAHQLYASILAQWPIGDHGSNIHAAIDHCNLAMNVFKEDAFPELFAETQRQLGALYLMLPTGKLAGNLTAALQYHDAASRIFTEATSPVQWARMQIVMGSIYTNLASGSETQNLNSAIECYNNALRVMTQEAAPRERAEILLYLGNVHQQLWASEQYLLTKQKTEGANGVGSTPDPPQLTDIDSHRNQRVALDYYNEALNTFSEKAFAAQWASAQFALGRIHRLMAASGQVDDLEKALAYFNASLKVFTEEIYPLQWASTEVEIGIVHHLVAAAEQEASEKQVAETQDAIRHYEGALRIFTPEASPDAWAWAQSCLDKAGRVYAEERENSIDVLSSENAIPIVVGDEGTMVDVSGLITAGSGRIACLVLSKGEGQVRRVPVTEETSRNVVNSDYALLVGLGADDTITSARLCPINNSNLPIRVLEEAEIKTLAEAIVATNFTVEFLGSGSINVPAVAEDKSPSM